MLSLEFVQVIKAVANGKVPNQDEQKTLIHVFKFAICDLEYMNAYWKVVKDLPRYEETIDEDHMRDATEFGLERLSWEELVKLVRDRFELLTLRDEVMERLRDPEISLDENDYWLKAAWEASEQLSEKP